MLALLLIVGILAGGLLLKRYIFKTEYAVACAVFIGSYSLILFYLLALGIQLNRITVLFPLLFAPFVVYEITRLKIGKIRFNEWNFYTYFSLTLLLIVIILCIMHVLNKPIFARDGLGLWLAKAKMLFLDRTLYSENFFNAYRIHDHPRYPLFWPIIEAAYFFTGGINERMVKTISIVIWLLIIGILAETFLKKLKNAAPLLLVFSIIPAYYLMPDGSLDTGYADVPLSLFYLCTYIFLFQYMRFGSKKYVFGAGFSLAFCLFTKEEGIAFALSVFILFLFIKKRNADILWLLACSIIPVMPWFLIRMRITHLYAEQYLQRIPVILPNLVRIPTIFKNAFLELVNFKHWGIFWLIILGFAVMKKNIKYTGQLILLTVILFVFYFSVFVLTPWDADLQMKVVFPRMLLHVAPSMVFLLGQKFLDEKNDTRFDREKRIKCA